MRWFTWLRRHAPETPTTEPAPAAAPVKHGTILRGPLAENLMGRVEGFEERLDALEESNEQRTDVAVLHLIQSVREVLEEHRRLLDGSERKPFELRVNFDTEAITAAMVKGLASMTARPATSRARRPRSRSKA